MAKEQWKRLGLTIAGAGLLITVLGGLIGMAWTGSGKFTAYEKDIEANADKSRAGIKVVSDNQAEDRIAMKAIADAIASLQIKQQRDYKELKLDATNSMLRDERQSAQYTSILSHMTQQTESTKRTDAAVNNIQVDVGKIQTKMETLIKGK